MLTLQLVQAVRTASALMPGGSHAINDSLCFCGSGQGVTALQAGKPLLLMKLAAPCVKGLHMA
jgi:hypothetical protein